MLINDTHIHVKLVNLNFIIIIDGLIIKRDYI